MTVYILPSYQCVKHYVLNEQGTNFRTWVHQSGNLYININIARYMGKEVPYPRWWIQDEASIFIDHHNRMAEQFEAKYRADYKVFLRKYKWNKLLGLSGKTLGCWCPTGSVCHYKYIVEAFRQRVDEVGGILFEGEVLEGDSAYVAEPVVEDELDEGYGE